MCKPCITKTLEDRPLQQRAGCKMCGHTAQQDTEHQSNQIRTLFRIYKMEWRQVSNLPFPLADSQLAASHGSREEHAQNPFYQRCALAVRTV